MSYDIRQEKHYFLLTFSGVLDQESTIASYSSLLKNKNFSKTSHTIWDLRDATVEISFSELKDLASLVTKSAKQRSNKSKAAYIIIDPTDKAAIENYITATYQYPVEFKIFEHMSQAIKWLSI
jgi:hypothetical protein